MFGSIKVFIDMLFIHNPGTLTEFWLQRNINLLLRPYPIALYLQWFALGFFVIYKWSEKPLFLKQGLLIFVLACLNKETTILLTCIFAIHFFKHHKLNLSTYIYLLFIQIAMFVSIKIFIDMLFIHNPGGLVEFWLPRNINLLLRPYPIILYLQWFALGFFVIYKWSEKPLFLKQGLLILIPLLGTAVFWGWIIELRAYYEAYPIVMLLLAHSVASILGLSINTQLSSGPDHQWLPVTDQYSLRKSKAAVDHPTAEIQN